MLFSEEWLRHYINPALSSDELCETLTMGGLEVEGAEPIAPAFTGVIVAQVLTCDQHPNADKLHVCTVDIGKGEPVQIVCGAPNVKAGVKVPCATIGQLCVPVSTHTAIAATRNAYSAVCGLLVSTPVLVPTA